MRFLWVLLLLPACGVIERVEPRSITVEQASEAQETAARVRGSLLETPSGEVRFCTALTKAAPPACDGAYLVVSEYQVFDHHWEGAEELDGARWVDDITILGNAEGRMFVPVLAG